MERNEFLKLLGTVGVAACAGCTFQSCSGEEDEAIPAPVNVDFTLDLTASANAALLTTDGSVYKSGIIVVCLDSTAPTYTAVSQRCTHQGTTVGWDSAADNFLCPNHGSRFSSAGVVIKSPATSSLRKYNTELTGTNLRVFS